MTTDPADPAASGAALVRGVAGDLHRTAAGRAVATVVSPWSIVAALGMARAGAAGVTAAEMDAVLHAGDVADLPAALSALDRHLLGLAGPALADDGGEGELTIRRANAVWLQAGYPLEGPFTSTLATRYEAPLHTVDFGAAPEPARAAINRWVAERTAGRIPHLIPEGAVDELTRLVLTNAVHLLAPWAKPFRTEAEPRPFHLLAGPPTAVALMGAVSRMAHRTGDGWTSVTVPYAGRRLAMTVVVPDPGRFAEVDRAAAIADWLATGSPTDREVHLRLPAFALDVAADLGPVLAGLGMPSAFDPDRADFSAMTRAEPIHISAVAHQATITVDEAGTEAAAATAVVMAGRAAFEKPRPPIEITVDRPFLFVVHDVAHATPLFLGRVVDPT